MIQSVITRNSFMFLSLALLAALGMAGGCDRSETENSVEDAQHLMQGSGQQVFLTKSDIEQADRRLPASLLAYNTTADGRSTIDIPRTLANMREAARSSELAGSLIDLRADQEKQQNYQNLLQEVNAGLEKLHAQKPPYNQADLNAITSNLLKARQLSAEINQQFSPAAENQRRLESVERTLETAWRDNENDKLTPGWMLGNLQLMLSRGYSRQLLQHMVIAQQQRLETGRLVGALILEQNVARGLEANLPDQALGKLKQQLDGPGTAEAPSLRQQLLQSQEAIKALQQDQAKLQQELAAHQARLQELDGKYLQINRDAADKKGTEGYLMRTQAYELRVGKGDQPGAIFYESQVELAQNRLQTINALLEYQQLYARQISDNIARIEKRVADLLASPVHQEVVAGAAASQKLLKNYNEQLTSQLDVLRQADQQYQEMEAKARQEYQKAAETYQKTANFAREDLEIQKKAQRMARVAQQELKDLLTNSAAYYENAAAMMGALVGSPGVTDTVKSVPQNYARLAQEAKDAAAQIEIAPAEEPQSEPADTGTMTSLATPETAAPSLPGATPIAADPNQPATDVPAAPVPAPMAPPLPMPMPAPSADPNR